MNRTTLGHVLAGCVILLLISTAFGTGHWIAGRNAAARDASYRAIIGVALLHWMDEGDTNRVSRSLDTILDQDTYSMAIAGATLLTRSTREQIHLAVARVTKFRQEHPRRQMQFRSIDPQQADSKQWQEVVRKQNAFAHDFNLEVNKLIETNRTDGPTTPRTLP